MVILDTNVLSESVRPRPDAHVIRWLERQHPLELYTTAVTQAEIVYGLVKMPDGRRRSDLEAAIKPIFEEDFAGRILPFDSDAAQLYAEICFSKRRMGRPISELDAQIAAIARSHGAMLATRNTADFAHCGIELVNPWVGF